MMASLRGDESLERTETARGDTAHHQQMRRAAKTTVLFAVSNDTCCETPADAWQFFQLFGGSRVDIDEARASLPNTRRSLTVCVKIPAWQFDAGG